MIGGFNDYEIVDYPDGKCQILPYKVKGPNKNYDFYNLNNQKKLDNYYGEAKLADNDFLYHVNFKNIPTDLKYEKGVDNSLDKIQENLDYFNGIYNDIIDNKLFNDSDYKFFNRPVGLQNTGNSCFWNSTMQCLLSCKDFQTIIYNKKREINRLHVLGDCHHIIYLIYNFIINYEKNVRKNSSSFTPVTKNQKELYYWLEYGEQHDASELLIAIMGNLQGLNKILRTDLVIKNKNILTKYSIYNSAFARLELIYQLCDADLKNIFYKTKIEVEFIIKVPIQNSNTIINCINDYLKKEEITNPSNYVDCNGKLERISKKTTYFILPRNLIVQLKRFIQNTNTLRTDKNTKFIYINTEIELRDMNGFYSFELYAITCHLGGMGGGHYWAYTKYGNQWYLCNDSKVTLIDDIDKEINGKKDFTPYILYYRKKN